MDKKENIETAQEKERKPRIDWNKWDAIFFVILTPFMIFAMLVILVPTGGISYLSGRFDLALDFLVVWIFAIWMTSPLMIVITIFPFVVIGFFAIIGAVRLISNWNRYANKKRLIRITQIGISILVITIPFLPLVVFTKLYSPGYKPFTYGFRERMRSKADIEDIRDWLRTLRKEDCAGSVIRIPFEKWPKSLKIFHPHHVNLDLDENGNPKIRLTWGSGFGHWGFEIGMEDMEIPPSDFSQFGEYRLPLGPGAYVWHELQ